MKRINQLIKDIERNGGYGRSGVQGKLLGEIMFWERLGYEGVAAWRREASAIRFRWRGALHSR